MSVELKKRENHDDIDFSQMNGYEPCGIIGIQVYFFLPEKSACGARPVKQPHAPDLNGKDTKRKIAAEE